jgi:release factor glutamine methyltransferase
MRPLGAGVGAAVRAAAQRLSDAGVPSAEHDAAALATYVLGERALLASFDGGTQRRYDDLVARRARREPLQHLTGTAPFRHVELAVGRGVFVPRPETEGLVDLVLRACGPDTVAVDLCAGSGAIALAIATERPGTEVHAVEASAAALPWLARNAGGVVTVHHGAVADVGGLVADVVVSNPPYLPLGLEVEPEVAADPPGALWGGVDGLEVIREVVAAAARLLRPGGLLALEHDASHQPAVLECLQRNGFQDVTGYRDLAGRDRYATGVRMSA